MIQLGQKVKFDPFVEIHGFGVAEARDIVTGRVVFINARHKWFSVEYGDPKQRTSFNFADIGKGVIICGRK